MASTSVGVMNQLAAKLGRFVPLSSQDVRSLLDLPSRVQSVRRFVDLVREGDTPEECCLLLKGYACRYKETLDGVRQIVSFHVQGDLLDIQHLLLARADHSVSMITDGAVAWIPK